MKAYEATKCENGWITYWSVYNQQWVTSWSISDAELAAMPEDERIRVIAWMDGEERK